MTCLLSLSERATHTPVFSGLCRGSSARACGCLVQLGLVCLCVHRPKDGIAPPCTRIAWRVGKGFLRCFRLLPFFCWFLLREEFGIPSSESTAPRSLLAVACARPLYISGLVGSSLDKRHPLLPVPLSSKPKQAIDMVETEEDRCRYTRSIRPRPVNLSRIKTRAN